MFPDDSGSVADEKWTHAGTISLPRFRRNRLAASARVTPLWDVNSFRAH